MCSPLRAPMAPAIAPDVSPAVSPLTWIWGVDVAVSRLAFGYAPEDGGAIDVDTLVTATETTQGERLGLLDRQVRIFARQAAGAWPPAAVWVEQPSGRFRNLPLVYVTGVVQAALFETLGCPVWTLPSSAWKLRTVGRGNASKAQVAAWVAARSPMPSSQDEADAYAIAAAGRAMLVARSWEATA